MLTEPATIILSCLKCGLSLTAKQLMLFFSTHTILRGVGRELNVRAGFVLLTGTDLCRTYLL